MEVVYGNLMKFYSYRYDRYNVKTRQSIKKDIYICSPHFYFDPLVGCLEAGFFHYIFVEIYIPFVNLEPIQLGYLLICRSRRYAFGLFADF